ncbi:MAG: branched-chain amino acid aminotransferase [Rhodospirillaceae bacterium]|nr:branched-chain amino acid aminotransferase [Rhodospirillaceae bacterium]
MSLLPFDDRDGFIWYDGRLVPWRDAKIHVLSHGFHYASLVFEGERLYDGTIFKGQEHTERLFASAKQMDFTIPYSVAEINAAKAEVIAANTLTNGYVRPFAWRGSEQMGVSGKQNKIHVAVAVWEWPTYFSAEARMAGLKVQTGKWRRPAPDAIPCHAKCAGVYMICTLNKHAAEAAGFNESLMLDHRGRIAETTGANLLFVRGNEIHAPIPDTFLNGITRQTVLGLAKRRGYTVIERAILPEEMPLFNEAFVTGTAAEVTPVGSIDDVVFPDRTVTKVLMQDYEDLVYGRLVLEGVA